jgi:cyclopropane fatty-acyl-phospholipid synthase-like methyltransferase
MNDYDRLWRAYATTDGKPDKQHSMLSTVIAALQPLADEQVLDIGCGRGFFSIPFAEQGARVMAIDESREQLSHAIPHPNVVYTQADLQTFVYPRCSRICAPFVLGYLQTGDDIKQLFGRWYDALQPGGIAVCILDDPKRLLHDNRRFGSCKTVASFDDGAPMTIELFKNAKSLCTLQARYHPPNLVVAAATEVGFKVDVKQPMVDDVGRERFGKEFWSEYVADIDVMYLVLRR